MTSDPARDQKAAQLRDLERLRELIGPYSTGAATPVRGILAQMAPDARTETAAILERLDTIGEPPEKTTARQEILLDLARAEDVLQDIAARGQPLIRNGKVVTDPQTGQPLRDPAIDRRAAAAQRRLERFRSRLTGLPGADSEA